MPVTFGTFQIVPSPEPAPAAGAAPSTSPAGKAPPPDPHDLRPALHKLHARASRVRAH